MAPAERRAEKARPLPAWAPYEAPVAAPPVPAAYASPNGDGSAFERFRESNVRPQRQKGFSAVQIQVINLCAGKLRIRYTVQ